MQIHRVERLQAAEARGIVIVIDVIRAFSVAAYAFAGGARAIWLVREVEEAIALREREPSALLAGEVRGRLIAGFDFNNSPAGMAAADVRGRLLVQRTGAGTQGAVNATGAAYLLPCSLVTARATAAYARRLAEATGEIITLMTTESSGRQEELFMEDYICADYLETLLRQQDDAPAVLEAGIQRLLDSDRLEVFARGHTDFPPEDVPAFLAADRFTFAMQGTREEWNGITFINTRRVDGADEARAWL